jgi:predicted metal-dependent hydrolase
MLTAARAPWVHSWNSISPLFLPLGYAMLPGWHSPLCLKPFLPPMSTRLAPTLSLHTRAYGAVPVHVEQAAKHKTPQLRASRTGVSLKAPPGLSKEALQRYLEANATWVVQALHSLGGLIEVKPLIVGVPTTVRWAGTERELVWCDAVTPRLEVAPHRLTVHVPLKRPTALKATHGLLRSAMEQHIQQTLAQRVPEYARILGQAPLAYEIKVMKTLWGRLTGRDRMALELSLALAPVEILEYVIAHEMGHLIERNHSAKFWAQVARLDPNYRKHDKWLNPNGQALKQELNRLLGLS